LRLLDFLTQAASPRNVVVVNERGCSMQPEPTRSDSPQDFDSALFLFCRRLHVRTVAAASAARRRISSSKVYVGVLAALAGVAIVLAAKFVFGVHGLLRLADVGGNVPLGPGEIGAGGAGAAGGATSPNPQSHDGCQSERDSVQGAEDALQAVQSLIDDLRQQLAQSQNQVAQRIVQLQVQAISAVAETASNAALSGIVANLLAELQSTGDPTSLLNGEPNPVDFFSTLSNLSDVMAGQAGAAIGWAQTGPFPLTLVFLNNLLQLQGQVAVANGLLNSVQDQQDKLEQGQNDLQNAQQALANCLGAGD
jgi:hypothetical protein